MKRPRSAKDDESGKGSGTQNLKRKWASLSANAQDRIRKMYAKLQSKDQREHQALLGSDEDMRQHQDDDEVPSMREVQRPSSGRAASSKQKPPVNNDRTVVLNPAPGEQTAIITQSDDNLYSEWNPAHGEYGYTSSGSANTARVEPRAGRTQSSNNSGSNSNSRPQSSRTIS